jgi:predicted permease
MLRRSRRYIEVMLETTEKRGTAMLGRRWLDDLLCDLPFAVRTFLKSASFTTVAVGSLALGIGANTAIFSAVNGLLLRPLPYPYPDRLVWIDEEGRSDGVTSVRGVTFVDWSDHSQTLEAIAAYNTEDLTLTGVGEPERLTGFQVSADFFPALGTSMSLGRNFLPEETRADIHVAILSDSLWQRRFGSDPGVIGQSIRLNGRDYTVVGVLPAEFRFFQPRDLWVPLVLNEPELRGERQMLLETFARLKPGVTPAQAAAELETIRRAYEAETPSFVEGRVRLRPLHDYLVGGRHLLLFILLGSVASILVIACANVANLMLARAVVGQKQLAIRAALGAGRSRLVRQILAESLVLALGGGACGLILAWSLTRVLETVSPPGTFGEIAQVATISIDGRVVTFTLLASLVSGVLFGVTPALQFSRLDLTSSLNEGRGRGLSRRQGARQVLLVTQVALSVVLLIGAGLLLRSFVSVFNVDPGFRSENVLTLRISLPHGRYPDHARRVRFQEELLEAVAAVPWVQHVGAITNLPLTGIGSIATFTADGTPTGTLIGPVELGMASPDYFRALGIRLRAGRLFEPHDTNDTSPVIILSQSLARILYPGQDPLGRHVPLPFLSGPSTVVGVVDDVRRQGLDEAVRPQLYVPYQQMSIGLMTLVVRTSAGVPQSLAAAVRKRVLTVDPDQPVYDVMTMEERVDGSVAPRRFTLMLLAGLALLALLLAAGGVYGVIAQLVAQRTREVGIRMALGAQRRDVLRLFVTQGMVLATCGVATGLLAALGLTRLMASLLFGITASDPFTFVMVAVVLTSVTLLASWLPARRATAVDPLVAVRSE